MTAVLTSFDITPIAEALKVVTTQERDASVRVAFDLVDGKAENVTVVMREVRK